MPAHADPPPLAGLSALARSFRHRGYRLFFAGQLISLTGTWMQQVAQSWLVYRLTDSSLSLGLVGFAGQFPVFLLGLFGGIAADRLDRRRVLMATQAAALLQAALLAGLTFTGQVQVWQVAVLAALLGVVNAVDIPTRQSFVVELVGKADLHNAIALNSSMFNAARILGPSLAGLLLAAVGEAWCFAANGLSFLAVLFCLWRMGESARPAEKAQAASVREHLLEGLAYAWGTPQVRAILLLLGAGSVFGMSYTVLMPVFAREVLGGGAGALGVLMSAAGCGSLAGALMLAMRREGRGIGRVAYAGVLAFGCLLVCFALSERFWLSAVLLAAVGFCMLTGMASANTMLQTLCPDHLRGRVMALYSMVFMGMAPLGSLLSGALAHAFGAPATVAACGLACVAVLGLFGRGLLKL